jgi:hypothetical protein
MLKAKFAVLRDILLSLGFTMQVDAKRIRFDHPETKTWFLYPPYTDDEEVYAGDLVAARHLLDMKGFMPREQFEELLRQKLVAG